MKLRIRLLETKETVRIETPEPCSFLNLKNIVAAKLSAAAVDPQFVHLSLNQKEEFSPADPNESLVSLGILSGDLLYLTLRPPSGSLILAPSPPPHSVAPEVPMEETPQVQDSSPIGTLALTPSPPPPSDAPVVRMDETPQTGNSMSIGEASDAGSSDAMDVDFEGKEKTPSVPCFLKKVIEAEKGEARGGVGLVVIAVHAAFLESGFVVCDTDGSRLPQGWASAAATISVRYTVPDLLVGSANQRDVEVAVLKFAVMGKQVSVYGLVTGDRQEIYRVALDASNMAPLLASLTNTISEVEEKQVFEFWKTVKDGLCLPLLIDICQKNGLPPPHCFARLPTDVKVCILQLLPGVDVARIGCTHSEMRYLASDDELWKQKFLEEFRVMGDQRLVGRSWKDKFAAYWMDRKKAERWERERENFVNMPPINGPRYVPYWRGQQMFPMVIGGDYDRFPDISGSRRAVPRPGFLPYPAPRFFSPPCLFGDLGEDAGFNELE